MKSIILAGGYAKRLWPLTEELPKTLLEVGGKAIIEYIIRKIEAIDEIDEILVSTNKKFKRQLGDFLQNFESSKKIKLIIEETEHEGEKLGSIGGIDFIIKHENLDDDTLVVFGDNLFEFNLKNLVDVRNAKKAIIGAFDVQDLAMAKQLGIMEIDENNRIIDFEEKPKNPKSTFASTGIYYYSKDTIKKIAEYLDLGMPADRMGDFISWLYKNDEIYAFPFKEKWFDIGCKKSLENSKDHYEKKIA